MIENLSNVLNLLLEAGEGRQGYMSQQNSLSSAEIRLLPFNRNNLMHSILNIGHDGRTHCDLGKGNEADPREVGVFCQSFRC
jgi:hypothetical protein